MHYTGTIWRPPYEAASFLLQAERLLTIAELIAEYLPSCNSIGCFARITDVTGKTEEELKALHKAGYDDLTIGIETGDEQALQFMNKGYTSEDIIAQCKRLDHAGFAIYMQENLFECLP